MSVAASEHAPANAAGDHPVIRINDCAPQPWANGGGVTRVVTVGRLPGSSVAFDWRLSVADVAAGPFSSVPGVDRVITVGEGSAATLLIDGRRHPLIPLRPLGFSGDAHTTCETAEPLVAFNVMTRRGSCTAEVSIRTGTGLIAAPLESIGYLTALTGLTTVRLSGAQPVTMRRYDSLRLSAPATLRTTPGARFALVRIRPVANVPADRRSMPATETSRISDTTRAVVLVG